jgi:signal transduction histidine kinase
MYLIIIFSLIFFFIRIKTLLYKKRQIELENEVNAKTKSLLSINKYLIARNRAKEQGLAIVNHDLLTPLKYLHISANSLLTNTNNIDFKETVQEIANTTKELEYLTRNMLNWVKYDNTNKLPNSQEVDIHLLVQKLIDYTLPFIGNKDVKLENKVPVDTKINNWPDPLRVILYNILINAIKSTEKGVIKISIDQSSTNYNIKITDTGIGMSATMSNYLITGKSKDDVENLPKYKLGNGVGYQIIRNIVKLMKAKLIIDSKEDVGTTISIEFSN